MMCIWYKSETPTPPLEEITYITVEILNNNIFYPVRSSLFSCPYLEDLHIFRRTKNLNIDKTYT